MDPGTIYSVINTKLAQDFCLLLFTSPQVLYGVKIVSDSSQTKPPIIFGYITSENDTAMGSPPNLCKAFNPNNSWPVPICNFIMEPELRGQ